MRKKVTLAYITNDQERKSSFRKRKTGFLKKLTELSTLCDVEACCILYSPYETGPVVWPNPEMVHAVLERYKTVSPLERIKKTVDQEGYNTMRINKIHDQWNKIHRENKRKMLELYMFQVIAGKMTFDYFDIRDAAAMNFVINQWLSDLDLHINNFQGRNGETSNGAGGSSSDKAAADVAQVVAGVTAMSEANLMVHNDNNAVPNYWAFDDGRFSLLGDGNARIGQLLGFDVDNNDGGGGGGGGGGGDDGGDDDDIECSSSGDDDTDEDDDDDDEDCDNA